MNFYRRLASENLQNQGIIDQCANYPEADIRQQSIS